MIRLDKHSCYLLLSVKSSRKLKFIQLCDLQFDDWKTLFNFVVVANCLIFWGNPIPPTSPPPPEATRTHIKVQALIYRYIFNCRNQGYAQKANRKREAVHILAVAIPGGNFMLIVEIHNLALDNSKMDSLKAIRNKRGALFRH